MVVACLPDRVGGPVHGDQVGVPPPAADVLALQAGGGRQHDVGVPGGGGPVRLVHHDRVGPAERGAQPAQVLVVVERVAAGPVDQPDVRVGEPLAVVVVGGTRAEQHVRDPGDRDERAHRVVALAEGRQLHQRAVAADVTHGAVAVAEPAAGQPDLAEHRGQRQRGPDRLLAVPGALQRPGDRDHGARGRHPPRQAPDRLGLDAAHRPGPFGVLGHAVGLAEQVALERVVAGRAGVQELLVMQALGGQRVREPEHQRDVRRRDHRVPLGVQVAGQVRAERADQHDLGSVGRELREIAGGAVRGHPARGDGHILLGDAAERDDQLGVRHDRRPGRRAAQHQASAAHQVRQQHLRGAEAVGVARGDVAAAEREEPVQLALRVVEPPGAGPPVRATEDRLVAVSTADPGQLGRDQVQRGIPADFAERVVPAPVARAGTVVEPAAAHRRPPHPGGVPQRAGDVAEQRGRRRVVRVRRDDDLPVRLGPHPVRAPVRGRRPAAHAGEPIRVRPSPPGRAVGCAFYHWGSWGGPFARYLPRS